MCKHKTSTKYCDICGYKIRGYNHSKGRHHKQKKRQDTDAK